MKSLPLLARWRRILLDPRTPQTAARIAHCLGEAHRLQLYGGPEARFACQVLLADGLRQGANLQARFGCAYQLRGFLEVRDEQMQATPVPCPPEALLAAGDLGAAAPPAAVRPKVEQQVQARAVEFEAMRQRLQQLAR